MLRKYLSGTQSIDVTQILFTVEVFTVEIIFSNIDSLGYSTATDCIQNFFLGYPALHTK